MLSPNVERRATLANVMTHTWITREFAAAPINLIPIREPLTLPLDPEVIHKMYGFDFGTPEFISVRLTEILQSEHYKECVYQHQQGLFRKRLEARAPERKRSVFDFYKRRKSSEDLSDQLEPSLDRGEDPLNAYHPLISIYFLVREKMERERQELRTSTIPLENLSAEVQP
jgi:hypothetical protein